MNATGPPPPQPHQSRRNRSRLGYPSARPIVTGLVRIVMVTNASSGVVLRLANPLGDLLCRQLGSSGYMAREPAATNLVTLLVTNTIPVFETNLVQVPVTNLVASPGAIATIEATGSVVNTFLPGIGSIVALVLGGLYHGYRQVRNRKVNEALVQGVETARAILETTLMRMTAGGRIFQTIFARGGLPLGGVF